ncbi:MAG: DUF2085 domain-containing protein [Anaerolineae bacterium]
MAPPRPLSPWERRLVIGADRLIYWLTQHWLLLFNTCLFLFLGLAFVAPVLQAWGYRSLGGVIFRAYHRVCHQQASRSFFVLGQQVAFCQRDVGVYAGLVAGGLLYSLSGRRLRLTSGRLYLVLFVLPLAVDGLTQLVELRESNWLLRVVSGSWFGIGTVLIAYPLIAAAMADTKRELEERFGPGLSKLVALQSHGTREVQDGDLPLS